ncbi:hypothetical protein LSAT2_019333 [Lamellibrachia satsuma]|nr:hypothetical protein LSAT2_019333 [Lamellibrachia satsuma]
MFSADDSFELSEEDFLQAAVDIENLCPETGPLKRTSFELGVGTDRSCSPKEKITQAQSTTTSDISTTDQLCLEILRVEGQKQQSQVVEYGTNLPPRQAVSMLISHNSAFGPEIKSPGISSSHTKNAHKQVSDVSEISRVLQTPVKSLGGLGLTEASPMTHQPLWKEGPVRTRPVSLRATKKRKFPGPAGKLPQLTSSEVFDGVAVNRCDSPVITPAQVGEDT